MSKAIYKITVCNFRKHNPGIKKGYKYTLLSNRFFDDAKINVLPTTTQLLLIKLILICGDTNNETISISEHTLNKMLSRRERIDNVLNQLQSLQILTYEKNDLFIKLNKKKLNEIKVKESSASLKLADAQQENFEKNNSTSETWRAYEDAYLLRWNQNPVRNAQVNSQMKKFVERVGVQDAPDIAKFYLAHNKKFYIEKCHPVGLMLADAEALATQWKNNSPITDLSVKDIKKAEKQAELSAWLKDEGEGGLLEF